jgi:hypothetical protein
VRFIPRIAQRHQSNTAKPDVATLAADDSPQHPTLRTFWRNGEIQAITVCDASGA